MPHIGGSYVEAGATLARIQKQGTSYVQAEFRLSSKEYGLIRTARTATIILPNQRTLKARITAVRVRTRGKTAVTQLRARTPRLDNRGLFATGTPLRVQVRLPRHNLLDRAEHTLHGLLTPGATR